jgi:hypothetical protein
VEIGGNMKKIIKSWGFVFGVSVLLLLLCFFLSLYRIEASSPSKGWSKAISIADIDNTMVKDFSLVRVTTLPIVKDNYFVSFWETENTLNYESIKSTGDVIKKGKINYKFPQFDDINSMIHNGNIEIFGLCDKGFYKYVIDLKKQQVSSQELIDRSVKNFIIKNDMIVYSTKNAIKLIDNQGIVHIVDKVASDYIDAADDNDILCISYVVVKPQISASFNYAAYNYSIKNIKLYKGTTLTIAHSSSLVNSVLGINNKNVTNLIVFRDWDSGNTWSSNINFKLGEKSEPKMEDIALSGYNPSPVIIKSGNNYFQFIASDENYRSYKTSFQNLAMFTVQNNKIVDEKFLTKTEGISKEPKLFTLGKNSYLEWEDVSGSSKSVNFASTSSDVIKKAKKPQAKELGTILINTMVGTAWGLTFMFLFIIVVVLPALLLIVIVAMGALRWLESNTHNILNISIGLQLAAKLIITFVYSSILTKVKPLLPNLLQNTPVLILVIVLTTVVATYCVKRKYGRVNHQKSIFEQYIFFAIIDLVLYSLIFYPYYSI